MKYFILFIPIGFLLMTIFLLGCIAWLWRFKNEDADAVVQYIGRKIQIVRILKSIKY